jgi:hypothetical protein
MAKKHRAHPGDSVSAPAEEESIEARSNDLHREKSKSGNFFSIYANDIQVQTGPWDVRLILGEIGSTATRTPELFVEELGQIRISPQLAKKLTMILAQQLKAYEERFGEIPGPPD